MGNCLDCIFGNTRSALRQQSLLSHRQLTGMIRQSTLNDPKFYSSSNLVIVEQFLSNLNSNSQINADFVNKNLDILHSFIQNLRDKYSEIGRQYLQDQDSLQQQALAQNKDPIHNDLVVLRIQVQVLLLNSLLHQTISDKSDYQLFLQICENPQQKNNLTLNSHSQQNNSNHTILSIKINTKQKQPIYVNSNLQNNTDFNNDHNQSEQADSPTKIKKNHDDHDHNLIQIPIFTISKKIVNKNSKLTINLFKNKKNIKTTTEPIKSMKNKDEQSPTKLSKNHEQNSHILIAHTSLSVSDFIYYTSLMITDVVTLNAPNSIKSSITTSASTSSPSPALITVRGQGILGQTFQKDYIRIIKQHQTVAQQLQLCLQGQKAWQKLSLFKQSSESKGSQKNQSIYSEYSIPQDNNLKYKL